MEEMNRQGLLVWLKALVESGRCSGVTWVDKEKGVFQIPWSNQKSRNWQKEDSRVFLEYAKHTRKYSPNDSMDFPRWKQNLKSAINKNRFIERLRDKDHLSGPKPHRVYRFLSEATAQKRGRDKVVVRSMVCSDDFRGCQLSMKAAEGGVFVSESICDPVRSMSTSNSASSYSESELPLSPVPSMFLDCRLSLSPDILRGDPCDQQQGNIPVFVGDYCDGSDILLRDTSHNVSTPEPSQPVTYYITDKHVDLSTFLDRVPGTPAVDDPTLEASATLLQVVDTHSHQSLFQTILVQAHPEYPEAAPQAMAVTPCSVSVTDSERYVLPRQALGTTLVEQPALGTTLVEQPASQVVSCFGLPQIRSPEPGTTYPQVLVDPTSVQKYEITSTATASSTNSPQHRLSDTHLTDRVAQQAGPRIESACTASSTNDTVSAHNTHPSFSELISECSSDLPSSMDTSEGSTSSEKQHFSGSQFTTQRNSQVSMSMQDNSLLTKHEPDDSVMHVQVLYGTPHRTVEKVRLTSSQSSCRLFFGSVNTRIMQNAMQGPQIAEEVELPAVDYLDYDEKTKSIIRKTLKEMELGIVISYRYGDIYVERRCLPRVFLSDGVCKSESLSRSRVKGQTFETKAFDFNKQFIESIELNARNEGPVPKDHFFLTVGYEIIPNDDSPTRLVPVYIVVRHVMAAHMRFNILGASAIAPNPMLSDPNSFDNMVALYKEIDLKKES